MKALIAVKLIETGRQAQGGLAVGTPEASLLSPVLEFSGRDAILSRLEEADSAVAVRAQLGLCWREEEGGMRTHQRP